MRFRCRGKVHASDKSFNNHWGVPLTLARMPADCDYAVFEIGMNHAGEIRPLVKMVRPHVAIVTLIAAAHLGHFRNLDEIAAAKAEIFEGVEPGGAALINRDDERWKLLDKAAQAAGVENRSPASARHSRSTYRLLDCKLHPDHSTMIRQDRPQGDRRSRRRAGKTYRAERARGARGGRSVRRRSLGRAGAGRHEGGAGARPASSPQPSRGARSR
jgi:hypothetical protein